LRHRLGGLAFIRIADNEANRVERRADGGKRKSIVDLLAMPDGDEIEVEWPRLGDEIVSAPNLDENEGAA
jgi:hypothetical protein